MLILQIPKRTLWDEKNEIFIYSDAATLQLEHSLLSVSKWESLYKKPFLTNEAKNLEETKAYVKCMTINKNVPPEIYDALTPDEYRKINEYIDDKMTATFFNEEEEKKQHSTEQITSELIYYWMVSLQIPFECEKWHLSRLITLIKVCNVKNSPPKKHSMNELYARHNALNAKRKAKKPPRRR